MQRYPGRAKQNFEPGCEFGLHRLGGGSMCPPYAATHVPLALVVTQRRQAFWQLVLVAGSFDRFVNSARRLYQAGVQTEGGAVR